MPTAFATSGECSYHGGVNCVAGPNVYGDAICNDGWASSVLYSQTSECNQFVTCLPESTVDQMNQELENTIGASIQQLENEKSAAVVQLQQSQAGETGGYGQTMANNSMGGVSSMWTNFFSNLNQQHQAAIDSLNAQYDTQIASLQSQLVSEESSNTARQCTPQQEAYLNYVSSSDACFQQYGVANCLASGNNPQTQPMAAPVSVPTGLSATPISSSQINLHWFASGAIGISGFKVYRNGNQIATTPNTSYSDFGLTPGTSYSYTVADYDINGNISAQSPGVVASTLSAPITTSPPLSVSATQSTDSAAITSNLTLSSSGNDVVTLQKFLVDKGFLTIPVGVAEGYFGSLTKQALVSFQSSVGLPDTGYCGPMTRQIINGQ